jgi:iron complex outermembrane receptor protein
MQKIVKWPAMAIGAAALNLAQAQTASPLAAPAAVVEPPAAAPVAAEPVVAVVVTGSRIARRDADTVGPMVTLTREDMKFAAPTSLGDLVQSLPNAGVSLNSNGTQGTSFGVSSINLRYLGSAEGSGNRTLVLVDGHRWGNAAGGRGFRDFVDLNTIPLAIIDSIEVLKDGASAIYGADAIAGVVNVHTRHRLDGFEADLRVGETSRNDNANYNGFLNWGKKFSTGRIFVSASYNDSKPILTRDRPLTAVALTPLTAPPTSPRGLFVLPGLSNNTYFGTPTGFAQNAANAVTGNADATAIGAAANADNSFHVAHLPEDSFNTQVQGIDATGPSQRWGLFGRLNYDLTPEVGVYVEALATSRSSSQLFAPFPLDIRGSNGFTIPNNQAYNPFGTANGVPAASALAFSGSTFRVQRVPVEVGNRDNRQGVDMSRVLVGLDGSSTFLGGDWKWDAVVSYSKTKATFDAINQVNLENVYRALGSPANCSAASGCVPLDIFGAITPEMANYIRYNGHDVNGTGQTDLSINATRTLIELPGGSLGLAGGYEYRRETAYDHPDAFAGSLSTVLPKVSGVAQAPTTAQSRDATTGSYHLQEAYLELSAPLLAGLPGVDKLELDAAVRYSDYSSVGSKSTSKFGVLYRPAHSLLLRGTYSQGFRAPSILELYQGQRQTNFPAVDPCNGGGTGQPGCAGVPASYNQSQFNSGLARGITAGNANLKPETAETTAIGASFAPEAVRGLSLTADKFKIRVKDAIAAQSASQILLSCARAGVFCDLVQRAPSGELLQLTQAVVNLARIEVEGVDATLRYTFPAAGAKVDTALDLAYLQSYKSFIAQPDGSIVVDERAGKSDQPRSTFARMKGQASVRYLARNYSLGWKLRYIGGSDDIPGNAVNGGKLAATMYHDLQWNYAMSGSPLSFALGVDNVADRQPPASAANNPINFDIYTYDVRGRYFYAKMSARF